METWHTLTPPELILLQKHIELGKEHLVTLLGKQGFQELLQLGKPKQGTLNELKEDNAEISGIALLTVNTILTGTFGGWMGFSAVMEFDLSSRWAFWMIFSLAILVGAAIGYQNFRFTKQAGERAVQTLKLLELKLDILEEIHRQRKQDLREIRQDLPASPLSPASEKKKASPLKKPLPRAIERLMYADPRKTQPPQSWLRQNARPIAISLIPTLFGGFGSLFVYLSGSTQIASDFEFQHLVSLLTSPQAKVIKVAIAIVVTLYFGFVSLYNNRKAFKRSVEIKKKQAEAVKKEAELTLLDEQLVSGRGTSATQSSGSLNRTSEDKERSQNK